MPTRSGSGQKPNVVSILSDNLGYGDLGPYGGGELHGCSTPRLDQFPPAPNLTNFVQRGG